MSSFFNTLKIENFGPIKKATIEVKDMLVFIGPQAVGKSTLAKLITILDDINFKQNETVSLKYELDKYNIGPFLKDDTYISYDTPTFSYEYKQNKEQKVDLYNLSNDTDVNKLRDDKKIELLLRILGAMLVGIYLDNKKEILFRELQKNDNYGLNKDLKNLFNNIQPSAIKISEKLITIYNKNISDINEISQLIDLVKQIFSLIKPIDSLYIPAERTLLQILLNNIAGLINNDILIPKNILIASQQLEIAIKKINFLNLDVVGKFTYKRVDGQSLIFHNAKDFVSINETSSGLQSFLPIILLIENSLKSDNFINLNYVVEEPELNLYPEAQYKLVKYLVKNCLETTREIKTKNLIITTHSPYVLASINNLLLAHNRGEINKTMTSKIIEECSWIDPNHFNAYEVKKGTVKRIFNKKSKLIEDNIIDEVSEIIMQDFKSLALINDKSN